MSVHIDKKGNLVVTIKKENTYFSPTEELEIRREAIYQALSEHNRAAYTDSDMYYGLTELLKDFNPTTEQWQKVLEIQK